MFGKNDSRFKSKIQLAKELVDDALDKHITFSCVVTESWYASVDFIESLHSKNMDCQVPIKVVVFFDRWHKEDVEDKDFHIIFSTDTSLHFDTIINLYLMRWGIEHLFKHLKDIFYFDHYQVRHQKQIQRYWALCILALSMVYWIKQNGCLTKIIPKKIQTFNQYRDAIKSLIELDSLISMSKNRALINAHCPIKSNRLLVHLKWAA